MDYVPAGSKVLVAMSGGVDSSVAAAILKQQGLQVIGVHLQLSNQTKDNSEKFGSRCCSLVDANDARKVCGKLDIPYYVINASELFQEKVVDYFVHEYIQRRTPNPCVMCNSEIKFDFLFYKAKELGCDFVATGHYAQIIPGQGNNPYTLAKAVDTQKDQSYFLFGMTQEVIRKTIFPLGSIAKSRVRKLATEFGFPNADKDDSMEICFIGAEGYKAFIESRVPKLLRPRGSIMTIEGRVVGQHEGPHAYTVGQRKGLPQEVSDPKAPMYVVGFDRTKNALLVGPESMLMKKTVFASKTSWITPFAPLSVVKCRAKIRSRHEEALCSVLLYENDTIRVEFEEPQRAITPGQAIVFYDNNSVLGGGFIDEGDPVEIGEVPKELREKRGPEYSLFM